MDMRGRTGGRPRRLPLPSARNDGIPSAVEYSMTAMRRLICVPDSRAMLMNAYTMARQAISRMESSDSGGEAQAQNRGRGHKPGATRVHPAGLQTNSDRDEVVEHGESGVSVHARRRVPRQRTCTRPDLVVETAQTFARMCGTCSSSALRDDQPRRHRRRDNCAQMGEIQIGSSTDSTVVCGDDTVPRRGA